MFDEDVLRYEYQMINAETSPITIPTAPAMRIYFIPFPLFLNWFPDPVLSSSI